MDSLPWLLVHGPVVWQTGLALILLGALVVARGWARRDSRLLARKAREGLGPPLASLREVAAGTQVTLRGRIETEGAPADGGFAAISLEFAKYPYASTKYLEVAKRLAFTWPGSSELVTELGRRAARVRLVVDESPVELAGPIDVFAGSRDFHGRGLFHAVAAGDHVRVRGLLRRDSGEVDAGDYRSAAGRWTMTGAVIAFEGEPVVTGPGIDTYARALAAGGVLFLATFGLGGEIAYGVAGSRAHAVQFEPAVHPPDAGHADSDAGLWATSVAAATPFRRRTAIEGLSVVLDLSHHQDERRIGIRAALRELQDDCAGAIDILLHGGQPERAAELATRCGLHREAARGHFALGEFGRASAALELGDLDGASIEEVRLSVRIHLLANRLGPAAGAVRWLQAEGRVSGLFRSAGGSCLADAIEARAGDAAARERMRTARGRRVDACDVLAADLGFPVSRGAPHLPEHPPPHEPEIPARWLELLAAERGGEESPASDLPAVLADPSLLVLSPARALAPALPGVERALADVPRMEGRPDAQRAQALAISMAAVLASASGDHRQARRLALLAEHATAPSWGGGMAEAAHTRARLRALQTAIELAAGDWEAAVAHLGGPEPALVDPIAHLLEYRRSGVVGPLVPDLTRWGLADADSRNEALELLGAGDGERLAGRWFERGGDLAVLRIAGRPSLRTGQADLLRGVRTGYWAPSFGAPIIEQITRRIDLALLAEAAGDEALGNELRRRAKRFHDALLRRDTSVLLAVLERL